jgi:hypothetical protein
LIFYEFGVGWIVGALAAVGIAFLSPQLDRFGGHFNLSYVCSIPLFIYLFLRFFKNPKWGLSIIISLTALTAALTHFYLYGFLAIIAIFFYTGYDLGIKKIWKTRYSWIPHVFIQLIIPFIVLQGFYWADSITDRPGYPWGFLVLRSYPQGIFLPIYKPYGEFLHRFVSTNYVEWEGIAFIGSIASLCTLILLWKFFSKLIRKNYGQLLNVTSNFDLNILFWASVAALLYSFGIPFILGLQQFVDYIGPLKQMRGIGRFSWIFYFVINIVVFYWLWNYWKNQLKKIIPTLLIVLALGVLYYDAYTWVRHRGENLENYLPEMQDQGNKTVYNEWINHINTQDFQAILPLPYFHIGSENIWIEGGCDIVKKALITGYQTGLPSMAVLLSRTSLSQTYSNISLMLDPTLGSIKELKLPSNKPLLLIAAKCDQLNKNEKRLIQEASLLISTNEFDYYSLPVNAFEKIYYSNASIVAGEFSSLLLVNHGDYYLKDSTNRVVSLNYDSSKSNVALFGNGCFKGIANQRNYIFDSTLPNADTSINYTASFWLGQFRRDLSARIDVTVKEIEANGNVVSQENYQIFRKLAAIDGDWALVEWNLKLHNSSNRIQVGLRNKMLHGKSIIIDEFLIRPTSTDVYKNINGGFLKNNRYYLTK